MMNINRSEIVNTRVHNLNYIEVKERRSHND
jgi:hypothetical protein